MDAAQSMNLPSWALTETCTVLERTGGAPNDLKEVTGYSWPSVDTVKCAIYPVSEKNLSLAGVLGVEVTKEVYLPQRDIHPQRHRLKIAGQCYSVEDAREWPGFTVVLVKEVTCPEPT